MDADLNCRRINPADPDDDGEQFAKALPLTEVDSEQAARGVAIRYGALAYDNSHYRYSGPEFDGTVDGVFRATARVQEGS